VAKRGFLLYQRKLAKAYVAKSCQLAAGNKAKATSWQLKTENKAASIQMHQSGDIENGEMAWRMSANGGNRKTIMATGENMKAIGVNGDNIGE